VQLAEQKLILVNAIDSTRNYGWLDARMLCCNQYSQSKIVVVIIFEIS
jgi:hypothetical protein